MTTVNDSRQAVLDPANYAAGTVLDLAGPPVDGKPQLSPTSRCWVPAMIR